MEENPLFEEESHPLEEAPRVSWLRTTHRALQITLQHQSNSSNDGRTAAVSTGAIMPPPRLSEEAVPAPPASAQLEEALLALMSAPSAAPGSVANNQPMPPAAAPSGQQLEQALLTPMDTTAFLTAAANEQPAVERSASRSSMGPRTAAMLPATRPSP